MKKEGLWWGGSTTLIPFLPFFGLRNGKTASWRFQPYTPNNAFDCNQIHFCPSPRDANKSEGKRKVRTRKNNQSRQSCHYGNRRILTSSFLGIEALTAKRRTESFQSGRQGSDSSDPPSKNQNRECELHLSLC